MIEKYIISTQAPVKYIYNVINREKLLLLFWWTNWQNITKMMINFINTKCLEVEADKAKWLVDLMLNIILIIGEAFV